MTSPKQVGGEFERRIAKEFSLWLTEGKSDNVLWRSSSSGGRDTLRNKQGKDSKSDGDIVCTDLAYTPFLEKVYLECKTYQKANFFFINPSNIKSNVFYNFFIKYKEITDNINKILLLIVHVRDGVTPPFIIYVPSEKITIKNYMEYHIDGNVFRICLLKDFFEQNKYEDIIK